MIRAAELTDLAAILELEQAGFDAASRWSEGAWTAELQGPDRHVVLAESHAESHAEAHGVATFQLVAGLADLHRVVVRPSSRGRGLAGRLIENGCAWAAGAGGRRMLLEVESDNAAALAAYHRSGFVPISRRDGYYGPGRDALVMQKELIG